MSRRTFIVNADDLGVSHGATLGILRAHLEGVVTSASLSPTGADYYHAQEIVTRDCPRLGIGLHFTLSAGRPVSDPSNVPLLIGSDGNFRWEFVSLLKTILFSTKREELLQQIEIELESQIQRLLSDGTKLDHVDSERHVHLIPGIFEKVVRAASYHNIPFVRGGEDLGFQLVQMKHIKHRFLGTGSLKYALLEHLRRRGRSSLTERSVRFSDYFASYLFTGRIDLVLEHIFDTAPDGITEIMVHPGIPTESTHVHLGNPGLEHYLSRKERRLEMDACIRARKLCGSLDLRSFSDLANGEVSE